MFPSMGAKNSAAARKCQRMKGAGTTGRQQP